MFGNPTNLDPLTILTMTSSSPLHTGGSSLVPVKTLIPAVAAAVKRTVMPLPTPVTLIPLKIVRSLSSSLLVVMKTALQGVKQAPAVENPVIMNPAMTHEPGEAGETCPFNRTFFLFQYTHTHMHTHTHFLKSPQLCNIENGLSHSNSNNDTAAPHVLYIHRENNT